MNISEQKINFISLQQGKIIDELVAKITEGLNASEIKAAIITAKIVHFITIERCKRNM